MPLRLSWLTPGHCAEPTTSLISPAEHRGRHTKHLVRKIVPHLLSRHRSPGSGGLRGGICTCSGQVPPGWAPGLLKEALHLPGASCGFSLLIPADHATQGCFCLKNQVQDALSKLLLLPFNYAHPLISSNNELAATSHENHIKISLEAYS